MFSIPQHPARHPFLVLLAGLAHVGCDDAQTKSCLSAYESAQGRILEVEAKSPESVSASLQAVEGALQACRAANRHQEVDQLIQARNELSAQKNVLERRARRKSKKEPTQEELAALERDGDPNCPRGQAYKQGGSKEIRCTGPHLIEMNLAQAKSYFEDGNFRVRSPSETTLEAEHGAERYTFIYGKAGTATPPSCVVLVPPPGVPWAEALARASGANPSRLKPTGLLSLSGGNLPYTVDEEKVIIRVGDCPKPSQP